MSSLLGQHHKVFLSVATQPHKDSMENDKVSDIAQMRAGNTHTQPHIHTNKYKPKVIILRVRSFFSSGRHLDGERLAAAQDASRFP